MRRLPPAIPLSPATALSSPHGIAPLAEIASGNSPIPSNGRPPGIIFIKTLPATSHSRENKRRFNFAAKIQPPRNAALIHTPPISKPGILKPLRNRKAVYLLLRRAQTNKRLMKLGFRGLLWYIANLLLNTLLFNRYYRSHRGDRRIARQSPQGGSAPMAGTPRARHFNGIIS